MPAVVTAISQYPEWRSLYEHWGTAYAFSRAPVPAASYRAVRKDDQTELTAAAPGELRRLVHADYLARPVPREIAP